MRFSPNPDQEPWVLIAGGFHRGGGMDKLNAALATYLLEMGHAVYLVAHEVEPSIRRHMRAVVTIVRRPAGSYLLGEFLLSRRGRQIAGEVRERFEGARVVVNGGNCTFGDINWVHTVHHQWPCLDPGAPMLFRLRSRLAKLWAKRQERACIGSARIVLANSERTRRDLLQHLPGLDPDLVRTVPLGADSEFAQATNDERDRARSAFRLKADELMVIFVGALGYDTNKGMDTLLDAWAVLARARDWNARLIVAGNGRGLTGYEQRVAREGLQKSVRFLGHTDRILQMLAAADLLVSPVRYEAYGLNAHEAVCRGVPVLISAQAGFAERMTGAMKPMLLQNPFDADELRTKLAAWKRQPEEWRSLARDLGDELRSHSSRSMAEQIVRLAQASI